MTLCAPPKVSIGLPVYNGERTIVRAIECLLAQSFCDFELIIADNASTDRTGDICRRFADIDSRIRYIRHPENLGMTNNFIFVLEQSVGEYFMWAATDDYRTEDFIELNLAFLDAHPEFVASACPNCFEDEVHFSNRLVRFGLFGSLEDRYMAFLENCWQSHGILFSLMRTEIIKKYPLLGQELTAGDWAINMYLASCGQIHRTGPGALILGRGGASSQNGWNLFRTRRIEVAIPLYEFSSYVLRLMKPLSLPSWWRVFMKLLGLNAFASMDQARSELYRCYCRHFRKNWRKLWKL